MRAPRRGVHRDGGMLPIQRDPNVAEQAAIAAMMAAVCMRVRADARRGVGGCSSSTPSRWSPRAFRPCTRAGLEVGTGVRHASTSTSRRRRRRKSGTPRPHRCLFGSLGTARPHLWVKKDFPAPKFGEPKGILGFYQRGAFHEIHWGAVKFHEIS